MSVKIPSAPGLKIFFGEEGCVVCVLSLSFLEAHTSQRALFLPLFYLGERAFSHETAQSGFLGGGGEDENICRLSACLSHPPSYSPPLSLAYYFCSKVFFSAKLFWVNRASREKTFFSFATGSKSGPMKYSPSYPLRKMESSALSSIERFSTEEKERGYLGAKK